MRRLVVMILLAVMLIGLFPLVESGIVPPWPAGYLMIALILAMTINAFIITMKG